MLDIVFQTFALIFGTVFVIGLMLLIYKRDAVDWEKLEAAYGRDWTMPENTKNFATAMLYSEGRPAKSLKGLLTIGLYPFGVGLRPSRIFLPFQKPIFVPYEDIRGWQQNWYIDGKSIELAFRKTPEMRLIMPKDQVEWILEKSQVNLPISKDRPETGNWPYLTFIYSAVMGAATLGLIIFLFLKYSVGVEF